ncbi:MAG: LuxR C-terminal-related transcriptional regulator [Candidatus Planktophila sp.]
MDTFTIEKPRILILDCNRFELATLADSLRMQGLDVVGQASDTQSALALFRAVHPHSVLFNYQGCDQSCIDLLFTFRKLNPSLGIVLLTDSPDLRLYGIRQEDLPHGTQLIEKSALSDLHEIRNAVDIANRPESRTAWVANEWDASLSSLTDIQIETLRLLALGLSNSDIGKARFVSEKSVEQTITRIAQHLHVVHEKGRNMRVILASEYFKWLGSPREHAI